MAFGTIAKWVWVIGGSFPHDPETVGDREPWCIQLSLYNGFRYLEYPKRFILATHLCSHCHRSRSFVVLPKTRQILGTGAFQADSRHGRFTMPGTSQTVPDYKPCTMGRQSHTFIFPAPYVIVSDITHALQTATVCMLAHISSLWTVSDYGVYRKRLCFTNRVCRNDQQSLISP